jgi:hypothetical protein
MLDTPLIFCPAWTSGPAAFSVNAALFPYFMPGFQSFLDIFPKRYYQKMNFILFTKSNSFSNVWFAVVIGIFWGNCWISVEQQEPKTFFWSSCSSVFHETASAI